MIPLRYALAASAALVLAPAVSAQFVNPLSQLIYEDRQYECYSDPGDDIAVGNATLFDVLSVAESDPLDPEVGTPLRRGPAPAAPRRARTDEPCPTSQTWMTWDADAQALVATDDAWTVVHDDAGRPLILRETRGTTDATGAPIVTEFERRYVYDAAGRVVEILRDGETGSTFAYDASGRVTQMTYGTNERLDLSYGDGPSPVSYVGFSRVGPTWVPVDRSRFSYTAAGALDTLVVERYDANDQAWRLDEQVTFVYDADGRVTEERVEELEQGVYVVQQGRLYTYGSDGQPASNTYRRASYDGSGTLVWEPRGRTEYTFTADGDLETWTSFEVSTTATGETATPRNRQQYTYADGALVERVSEQADAGVWTYGSRDVLTRDGSGRITEWVHQNRNTPTDAWRTSYGFTYGFDVVVDAEEAPASSSPSLAIGPNPAREATTLRFALAAAGAVRLTLHDVLGRELATLADGTWPAGDHAVRLDAAALAPGLYVVRLQAGPAHATRTLTVSR